MILVHQLFFRTFLIVSYIQRLLIYAMWTAFAMTHQYPCEIHGYPKVHIQSYLICLVDPKLFKPYHSNADVWTYEVEIYRLSWKFPTGEIWFNISCYPDYGSSVGREFASYLSSIKTTICSTSEDTFKIQRDTL